MAATGNPTRCKHLDPLYAALSVPYGVLLRASDPWVAQLGICQARADFGEPKLKGLRIRMITYDGGNLVIAKL
jgi:hypothetical protein